METHSRVQLTCYHRLWEIHTQLSSERNSDATPNIHRNIIFGHHTIITDQP